MEPSSPTTDDSEHQTLRFYGADDELPAAALEALDRRSPDELRQAADKANRRS